MGVALAETDQQFLRLAVPLAADEDPIAVVVGLRAGNNRSDLVLRKSADALEEVGYLFLFHSKLRLIAHVLILAAAAVPEVFTFRLDAGVRCGYDFFQLGPGKVFLNLGDSGLDSFALDHLWHEHDEFIQPANAFAAECDVVDLHFKTLPNFGTCDRFCSGSWNGRCLVQWVSACTLPSAMERPMPRSINRTPGPAKV